MPRMCHGDLPSFIRTMSMQPNVEAEISVGPSALPAAFMMSHGSGLAHGIACALEIYPRLSMTPIFYCTLSQRMGAVVNPAWVSVNVDGSALAVNVHVMITCIMPVLLV